MANWVIFAILFGFAQYAHRKCVQHWCNEKGDITCEICHQVSFTYLFSCHIYCCSKVVMMSWFMTMVYKYSTSLNIWVLVLCPMGKLGDQIKRDHVHYIMWDLYLFLCFLFLDCDSLDVVFLYFSFVLVTFEPWNTWAFLYFVSNGHFNYVWIWLWPNLVCWWKRTCSYSAN